MQSRISSTDPRPADDEVLIERVQRHDSKALEELYDRYGSLALGIAWQVIGDRQLAEDAVQEAFLGVWRSAGKFDGERGAGRPWLLGIVRHRAIDVVRRKALPTIPIDESVDAVSDLDVWDQVGKSLDREQIREALQKLPPEQRDAISLAFFGGNTYEEVARITDSPVGTVKGRMRLGLKKLRSLLIDMATEVKG